MRSSCWKEWDSKVVFSDRPSSSDSGKKLLNGANTNCNFCARGGRGGRMKECRRRTITQLINQKASVAQLQFSSQSSLNLSACLTKHMFTSNKTSQNFLKATVQVWHFIESLFWGVKSIQELLLHHHKGSEVLLVHKGGRYRGRWLFFEHTCVFLTYLFQELNSVPQALHLLRHVLHQAERSTCRNHTNTDVYVRGL